MRGRGAGDMKGGFAMGLLAVGALRRALPGLDVKLAVEHTSDPVAGLDDDRARILELAPEYVADRRLRGRIRSVVDHEPAVAQDCLEPPAECLGRDLVPTRLPCPATPRRAHR